MSIDRRLFLLGTLGPAAFACAPMPTKINTVSAYRTAPIDVVSTQGNLTNMIRVLGDADGGDVLFWFHGFIYAITPTRRPFPLVHFNGVNAMRFVKISDDSYSSTHHSISFMEDLSNHTLLETWTNPMTNEELTPKPNTFKGSQYDYSLQGTKMNRGTWDSATKLSPGMWAFGNESAWVTIDRPYASSFGFPWSEARTYEAEISDLVDTSKSSVLCRQHSAVTNPFPKWMNMPANTGHALWQANGRKLASAESLPKHIVERCEKYMPELFDYKVFKSGMTN